MCTSQEQQSKKCNRWFQQQTNRLGRMLKKAELALTPCCGCFRSGGGSNETFGAMLCHVQFVLINSLIVFLGWSWSDVSVGSNFEAEKVGRPPRKSGPLESP